MLKIPRVCKTFAVISCFLIGSAVTDIALARTYSLDADFDEGRRVSCPQNALQPKVSENDQSGFTCAPSVPPTRYRGSGMRG